MKNKDLLNELSLLYLIFKSRGISSRIRLQKLVCLATFKDRDESPFSFKYESHYYGPYSKQLREKTDELVKRGLIKEEIKYRTEDTGDSFGPEMRYSFRYSTTKKAVEFLKSSLVKFEKERLFIRKIVSEFSGKPNEFIIREAKQASGMESLRRGG